MPSAPLVNTLAAVLVGGVVLGGVLFAMTAMAMRVMSRNPARHRATVLTVALAMMIVVPVAGVFFIGQSYEIETAELSLAARSQMEDTPQVPESPAVTAGGRTTFVLASVAIALALLAAFWGLSRVAVGVLGIARRRKRLRPLDVEDEILVHTMCAPHGLTERTTVMTGEPEGPLVMGWRRPVIVLPSLALSALDRDSLRAVVLHEVAHVRRRDTLWLLLQRIVQALWFFHPGVHWMSRRLDLERELACDAYVVAAGCDGRRFAEGLADLAEAAVTDAHEQFAVAATSTHLRRRIQTLLATPPRTRRLRRFGFLSVTASIIAASVAIAAAQLSVGVATEQIPGTASEISVERFADGATIVTITHGFAGRIQTLELRVDGNGEEQVAYRIDGAPHALGGKGRQMLAQAREVHKSYP